MFKDHSKRNLELSKEVLKRRLVKGVVRSTHYLYMIDHIICSIWTELYVYACTTFGEDIKIDSWVRHNTVWWLSNFSMIFIMISIYFSQVYYTWNDYLVDQNRLVNSHSDILSKIIIMVLTQESWAWLVIILMNLTISHMNLPSTIVSRVERVVIRLSLLKVVPGFRVFTPNKLLDLVDGLISTLNIYWLRAPSIWNTPSK